MKKETLQNIIILFIAVILIHLVLSNTQALNHLIGYVVQVKEKPTNLQAKPAPKQYLTQPLKIRENYFKFLDTDGIMEISVSNIDTQSGNLTVLLSCYTQTTSYTLNQTVEIAPRDIHIFRFPMEKNECDYTYLPQNITKEINATE